MIQNKKALILFADQSQLSVCDNILRAYGFEVFFARSQADVVHLLRTHDMTLAISDARLAHRNLVSFIQELNHESPKPLSTRWLVRDFNSSSITKEAMRTLKIIGILPEDFGDVDLKAQIVKLEKFLNDPFFEVMDILEFVTGVQITKEKRLLVESRLQRRLHVLNIENLKNYASYFLANMTTELPEAVSLVTTHTTEFFREDAHFDYLYDHVFPQIINQNKISIWSAASSTGQEVYSIAIALLEFIKEKQIPPERHPEITILGTDIDPTCIKFAREGIYKTELLEGLPKKIVQNYFDFGTDALSGYARVKSKVHAICRFEKVNLLAHEYIYSNFDFVFLRNALIYFKPEDVSDIAVKISKTLKPSGYLFIGHSESISEMDVPFVCVGNSIYSLKNAPLIGVKSSNVVYPRIDTVPVSTSVPESTNSIFASVNSLIVIGSSTGGVEALKIVLEQLPIGCPPVLIAQHIPANFSAALSKRLNECCSIEVVEAVDGMTLENSHAYIAPGGKQMKALKTGNRLFLEVNDDPPVGRHKPSVDYLFNSVVPLVNKIDVAAALLTGMGMDGAQGLKGLKNAGAHTIAQDEDTSVVFGMPAVAIEIGATLEVLPIQDIPSRLLASFKRKKSA